MEIIQFVQHSILKKQKTCVNIFTTKKRSNSKAKNMNPQKKETYKKEKSDSKNPIICDRNEKIIKTEISKSKSPKS